MQHSWSRLGLALGGAGAARAWSRVDRRRSLLVAVTTLSVLSATGVAKADTFDFSYSGNGNGISAMGTFTAILTSTPGQYQVTGITGERNGARITGLIAQFAGNGNDNLLFYPANPGYFDLSGVAYSVGGTNYSIFYDDNYYEGNETAQTDTVLSSATVTPVPAPVPGGGLLSFFALAVAGLAWRRRDRPIVLRKTR